jgi:hypothetical protein
MEAEGARFGFELVGIGGIAVDVEAHAAGVEANDSIWTGSAMVQEIGDCLGAGFASFSLDGCERAKGNEES